MYIQPEQIQEGMWVKLITIEKAIRSPDFVSSYQDGELTLNCRANDDLFINDDMLNYLGGVFKIREFDYRHLVFYIEGSNWLYPIELIDDIVDSPFKPINLSFDEIFNGLDDKKFLQIRSQ